MNHDPLCPSQHDPDPKCHACVLIDEARRDEREKAIAAVNGMLLVDPDPAWDSIVRVCAEAIENQS